MKMYKGFEADMTSTYNNFQFEEGKHYHEDKAKLCHYGFHACEYPLDVLMFYPPYPESIYREVELEGVTSETREKDTKRVGTDITIGRALTPTELVMEAANMTDPSDTDVHVAMDGNDKAPIFILDKPHTAINVDIPDFEPRVAIAREHSSGVRVNSCISSAPSVSMVTGDNSISIVDAPKSTAIATGQESIAEAHCYNNLAATMMLSSAAKTYGDASVAVAVSSASSATVEGRGSVAVAMGVAANGSSMARSTNMLSAAITYNSEARAEGIHSFAATINDGKAIASGEESVALGLSGGEASIKEGGSGIAVVRCGRAKAPLGSAICIWKYDLAKKQIRDIRCAIVDGVTIKANTWYRLEDGKFVEDPYNETLRTRRFE